MVTVLFRLSDTEPLRLDIAQPTPLTTVLESCERMLNEEIGSVIVIRGGKIVQLHEPVAPGDTLELFPAISGG